MRNKILLILLSGMVVTCSLQYENRINTTTDSKKIKVKGDNNVLIYYEPDTLLDSIKKKARL